VPAAAALKAGDEAPLEARRHGLIALLLVIAGAGALLLPPMEGIALPGYTAIACLLLGAVFFAPTLSKLAFSRLPASGPAWQQIATAQLRGTARRSTVSIAAVLVSFSLMVAMAIMVYSFRNSLDAWMQRILPADLYVRAGSSGLTSYLDDDAQAVIRGIRPGAGGIRALQDVALPAVACRSRSLRGRSPRPGRCCRSVARIRGRRRPAPCRSGRRRRRSTCAGWISVPCSSCRSAARSCG
jgi:putative ABC transport system permease protein